jgi:hypothetical protein
MGDPPVSAGGDQKGMRVLESNPGVRVRARGGVGMKEMAGVTRRLSEEGSP